MPLKADIRKIINAEVVPWELGYDGDENNLYGIAYTITEGQEESEMVGTKAEAEKIVREIADQKVVAFDNRAGR